MSEANTQLPKDIVFPYTVQANAFVAQCRLRIFEQEHKTVVVATEDPDNTGMSITNAAEEIATQVCEAYDIDPERLVWIEHYPSAYIEKYDRDMGEETFDLVEFTWADDHFEHPQWTKSSRDEVERIIGQPLDGPAEG